MWVIIYFLIVSGHPSIRFSPYNGFDTQPECIKFLKENDQVLLKEQLEPKVHIKGTPEETTLDYFYGQCDYDPTRRQL